MKPTTLPRERLYFADWLRIVAFALLVLYHVGMLYVPWDFHVKHVPTYTALEPLMRLTSPWRMSLLFAVSGLATGLMLGCAGLARERSTRLLLPLLFGMTVVVPPQAWLQAREQFGYDGSCLDFLRLYFGGYGGFCGAKSCLILPTWNHLWFLPYLWSYTMLLLVALRVLPATWPRRAADAIACLPDRALLLARLIFFVALRVLFFPRWPETHALLDDWAAHASYGAMFACGVLLARRRVLLQRLEDKRWPALLLGLVAWAVLALYPGAVPDWQVSDALRLPMRIAFGAAQCCGVLAAFGFARRHLNKDHRWRAPLTEAVFPLYLVHQTIIIAAAVALRTLALSAGAEAAIIVVITFAGGFATWLVARRIVWLRPWMGLSSAARHRAHPAPLAAAP